MFLCDFLEMLKMPKGAHSRVTRSPHVSIMHSKEQKQLDQAPESVMLWERCRRTACAGFLGHAVANERIMAATVEDLCMGRSVPDCSCCSTKPNASDPRTPK
jgi:hypothetical protein